MINNELLEIVKADKKARERISDSSELTSRMQKKLDEDCAALNKKYAAESERIIRESREKHKKILEKSEASYNKRFEKTREAIEAMYREKKNAWVSEIVCKVTESESI